MKTHHTPGPWILEQDTVFIGETRKVQPVLYHGDSEGMANARLIAAAPDLLSALNLLLDKLHAHCPGLRECEYTESAITKAEMAVAKSKGIA